MGTPRDLVSNTGVILNHLVFDSFGRITSETAPSIDHLYAFTGREWDADAGLYYYRARWYDPVVARFLSEDPIGFAAGDSNLNRYVENNSTNLTDPSGLAPNKDGAIGLPEFIRIVRDFEKAQKAKGKCPQQILDELVGHLKDREDWLYIYTKKGWIDLQHFLEAASWQAVPDFVTLDGGGVGVEYFQLLFGWLGGKGGQYCSAFSKEDLRSNKLGTDFQDGWDSAKQPSLADALEEYFIGIGAANDPRRAPDYNTLPQDEDAWQDSNSWFDPWRRWYDDYWTGPNSASGGEHNINY